MTSQEVFPIDEAFPPGAWNEVLKKYPGQATVFHTRDWMKTLQDAFGYEPMCMLIIDDDEGSFHAALPFMVDIRYGIRNFFSMPFDTYGGAIGSLEYIPGLVNDYLNSPGIGVRYYVDFLSAPRPNECGVTTEMLDISRNEQEIWNEMHKDNRTAIRSAIKNGVEVWAETEYLDVFDKVPRPLLRSIVENMIPSGRCFQMVARIDEEIVAASIFFLYDSMVMYWANAVTSKGRKTNANYLLMWEAIQVAKSRGCTCMNFGASPEGADSLLRFKKSWGTTTRPYVKIQRVPALMKPIIAIREVFHG